MEVRGKDISHNALYESANVVLCLCTALKQIQWVYQRVQGDFGDLHFPAACLCIQSFLLHPSTFV